MPVTLCEPGDIVLTEDSILLGKVVGMIIDHDRIEVQFEGKPLPFVCGAETWVRVPNQVHNG